MLRATDSKHQVLQPRQPPRLVAWPTRRRLGYPPPQHLVKIRWHQVPLLEPPLLLHLDLPHHLEQPRLRLLASPLRLVGRQPGQFSDNRARWAPAFLSLVLQPRLAAVQHLDLRRRSLRLPIVHRHLRRLRGRLPIVRPHLRRLPIVRRHLRKLQILRHRLRRLPRISQEYRLSDRPLQAVDHLGGEWDCTRNLHTRSDVYAQLIDLFLTFKFPTNRIFP